MQPKRPALVTIAMLLVIAIPTALTLGTVRDAGKLEFSTDNPTPYGYTVSLLLFIVPVLAIGVWMALRPNFQMPRKYFGWTLALLIPLGFLLDLVFGNLFFDFPNKGAVLGIYVPGWDFATMGFKQDIPIEEFIFYISGFLVCLMLYIWLDEYWLGDYDTGDTEEGFQDFVRLVGVHLPSLLFAIGLIVAVIVFTHIHTGGASFPGYAIFLILASLTPTILLFGNCKDAVNWQAFSLTMVLMLIVSLIWEATLASPYGWWTYNPAQMMGIFIGAWRGLPVEAVFVWIMVTWTTVVFYETIRRVVDSKKPVLEALFGPRGAAAKK